MKKNPGDNVYQDERFTLGEKDGNPYLISFGKTYRLACHPCEPCLYITGEDGSVTAVRNSFVPSHVLQQFREGRTVTSITGKEYNGKDFCRMVAYAAGQGDVGIGEAERFFGVRTKKKGSKRSGKKNKIRKSKKTPETGETVKKD